MENFENMNLEAIKNKYEGKRMIAKIADMFGVKKEITLHSLVLITQNEKDIINFNYSGQINASLDNIPITLNIISIEDLEKNYEPLDSIQIISIKKSIEDMQNEAIDKLDN